MTCTQCLGAEESSRFGDGTVEPHGSGFSALLFCYKPAWGKTCFPQQSLLVEISLMGIFITQP